MNQPDQTEILNRLKLMEEMIWEGRRTTQTWGWSLLLWGLGPLIAIVWARWWPYPNWAWPVALVVCTVLNGIALRRRKQRGQPKTATMRSLSAIWGCTGLTVILLAAGAVWSGATELHLLYAALFALAAVAHGASSLILRWIPQFIAALTWWIASVAAFIVPVSRLPELAALALIIGNIGFGGWLAYRVRTQRDA
jgi:peptidoglycan/LPS O-acetylase OafA/YrhL